MKLWVGKKGVFTKLNFVGWKNNLCATRLKPNNKKLYIYIYIYIYNYECLNVDLWMLCYMSIEIKQLIRNNNNNEGPNEWKINKYNLNSKKKYKMK
jgi:hypothetical protein